MRTHTKLVFHKSKIMSSNFLTAVPLIVGLAMIVSNALPAQAAQSVVMNLSAKNETAESQKTSIVQYLPAEVAKEDILDSGGLQIRSDEKRSALFLYGDIELSANETKKIKVVLRDIWKISAEDIAFARQQIKSRVEYLQGTDDYAAGQALAVQFEKELAEIEASQAEQDGMGIPQRIELFRLASERMSRIKSHVTVMADFVKQARWLKESTQTNETLKMSIQVTNPIEDTMENQKVIRYLPRGVSPEDVVDAQGFSIKFDPERQLYYLYREMTLKPSETFSTTVVFRNAWKIPLPKLEKMIKTAEELHARLKGSQYDETAVKIFAEVERLANQIKELQAREESPSDMITNFSLNLTRFNAVEDGVAKLKELVEEIEHPAPQTLPYQIKPATPDVSTTWKIIYGFIGFLTVLGFMFYALWWGQSKARLNRKYETHKV